MKKVVVFCVSLCVLLLPVAVFAASAKIIDIEGDVTVKTGALFSSWKKAKVNMSLGKNAELKTGLHSSCTLAFDSHKKNIVTIKDSSYIRIDSVIPGDLYLDKGRVFSLIKNIKKKQKFQIKTPAAIAGARGTGWVTAYSSRNANISCFNKNIFVAGIDSKGNAGEEQALGSGFGINVPDGGFLGMPFRLGDTDLREWDSFMAYISKLTGTGLRPGDLTPDPKAKLRDLEQEARDDYSDMRGEIRRQEKKGGRVSEPAPRPQPPEPPEPPYNGNGERSLK